MPPESLRIIKWLESLDKENCKKFGKLHKLRNVAVMTDSFRSYIVRRELSLQEIQSMVQTSVSWEIVTRWNAAEVLHEYRIRNKGYAVFVREGMKLDLVGRENVRTSQERKMINRLQSHFAHAMAIAKLVASVRGSLMAISSNSHNVPGNYSDSVREPTDDGNTKPGATKDAGTLLKKFLEGYLNLKYTALFVITVQFLAIFSLNFKRNINNTSTYAELKDLGWSVSSETRVNSQHFAVPRSMGFSLWARNAANTKVNAFRDSFNETMHIIASTSIQLSSTFLLLYLLSQKGYRHFVSRGRTHGRDRRTHSDAHRTSE